jgi:hypothetical protein
VHCCSTLCYYVKEGPISAITWKKVVDSLFPEEASSRNVVDSLHSEYDSNGFSSGILIQTFEVAILCYRRCYMNLTFTLKVCTQHLDWYDYISQVHYQSIKVLLRKSEVPCLSSTWKKVVDSLNSEEASSRNVIDSILSIIGVNSGI